MDKKKHIKYSNRVSPLTDYKAEIYGHEEDLPDEFLDDKSEHLYNTIDYKDAFNHIRALANLEWNGNITITHFRKRINDIITVISKKETDDN